MTMPQQEEVFHDCRCPHCQHTLSFPESAAGSAQECPMCGKIVTVPHGHAAEAGTFPVPIVTSRLRLREPVAGDAPALAAFLAGPDVYRFWDADPMDLAEVEVAIGERWTNRLTQAAGSLWLAAESAGAAIGLVCIAYSSQDRLQGTFFVVLHPDYQRRGFGTELAAGLLDFAFHGIGLHRVAVGCDSRNEAAARMLEKAGMRREGQFLQDRLLRGVWVDTVQYAMLAHEFGRKPSAPPGA